MSSRLVGREALCAAGVVLLGGLLLAGASDIAFGIGYDRVGPRAFPYGVGGCLVVLGLALAWSGLRPATLSSHRARAHVSLTSAPDSNALLPVASDRRALATLGLALVAFVLLLDPAGFIVAAAVQFSLAARAFQSKTPARDALLGLAMAAIVYVAFTSGLGAALPSGWLTTSSR